MEVKDILRLGDDEFKEKVVDTDLIYTFDRDELLLSLSIEKLLLIPVHFYLKLTLSQLNFLKLRIKQMDVSKKSRLILLQKIRFAQSYLDYQNKPFEDYEEYLPFEYVLHRFRLYIINIYDEDYVRALCAVKKDGSYYVKKKRVLKILDQCFKSPTGEKKVHETLPKLYTRGEFLKLLGGKKRRYMEVFFYHYPTKIDEFEHYDLKEYFSSFVSEKKMEDEDREDIRLRQRKKILLTKDQMYQLYRHAFLHSNANLPEYLIREGFEESFKVLG